MDVEYDSGPATIDSDVDEVDRAPPREPVDAVSILIAC